MAGVPKAKQGRRFRRIVWVRMKFLAEVLVRAGKKPRPTLPFRSLVVRRSKTVENR